MAAILLDGRSVAERIRAVIAPEVARLTTEFGRSPKLVAVQIGEDASSAIYARNQKKIAGKLGIEYHVRALAQDVSLSEAEGMVGELNRDRSVDAILLQLPVPTHINAHALLSTIAPDKDAEGLHPQNIGMIVLGAYSVGPCTAMAVMELLRSAGAALYGKEAVVVGHSDIVGKPLALMLLHQFATTTVCHIATGRRGALEEHVRRAEVLVVAVGKPGLIKGEWIRKGAVVIDVGTTKVGDTITGDVEFYAACHNAAYITPVPGGVGPVTTAMLMRNTVELFKRQIGA